MIEINLFFQQQHSFATFVIILFSFLCGLLSDHHLWSIFQSILHIIFLHTPEGSEGFFLGTFKIVIRYLSMTSTQQLVEIYIHLKELIKLFYLLRIQQYIDIFVICKLLLFVYQCFDLYKIYLAIVILCYVTAFCFIFTKQ